MVLFFLEAPSEEDEELLLDLVDFLSDLDGFLAGGELPDEDELDLVDRLVVLADFLTGAAEPESEPESELGERRERLRRDPLSED